MNFEDKELIELFVENMSASINAVRPSEFVISHYNGPQFLEGLRKAAIAANGLAHTQHNPAWLMIRDALERITQTFKVAVRHGKAPPRARMTELLGAVLLKAQRMAVAHAVPRQEVLAELERRKTVFH